MTAAPSELATATDEKKAIVESREYLQIGEWSAAYVDADLEQCGLAGSPTKVKQIESVVFSAKRGSSSRRQRRAKSKTSCVNL